ncbi:MAG: STAS domain-containing protein [Pseudomonadales bacterium]|jgi:phospholipid transport system transporter-binding protein|nr:STAS domain-containing protein [Pseudomonadales bacterium]
MTAPNEAGPASAAAGVQVRSTADGKLTVVGELSFRTARSACRDGERALNASSVPIVTVDCVGVTRADSAGVAVLIEWLRYARRAGRELRFENLPAAVLAIARISEVDQLLLA